MTTFPDSTKRLADAFRRESGPLKASELLPLVYDELRRVARAQILAREPGQTLQATALVHEAWLRVSNQGESQWDCRAHFFGAAARAMRHILVEAARRKLSVKHGGEKKRVTDDVLDQIHVELPTNDLLAIHEALENLERQDPFKAQLVGLRFFAGLTMPEIADLLRCSLSHAEKQWRFARSWLQAQLSDAQVADSQPPDGPLTDNPVDR